MELCALPGAAGSFPLHSLINYTFATAAHLATVTWTPNPHYCLPNTEAMTPQQEEDKWL